MKYIYKRGKQPKIRTKSLKKERKEKKKKIRRTRGKSTVEKEQTRKIRDQPPPSAL